MNQRKLLNLLFKVTFGFVLGIIYATFEPVHPENFYYLLGGTVFWIITGTVLTQLFDEKPTAKQALRFFLIISVAFLVGWGRYSYSLGRLQENHVSDFTTDDWNKSSIVEGTVVAQPEVERFQSTLRVNPEKIWPTKKTEKPVKPSGGDIIVRISKDSYSNPSLNYQKAADNEIYGDKVRVVGALMEPFSRENPGGFSYKTFLRSKGIYGAMWSPRKAEILQRKSGNPIVAWALELQTEMLKTIKMTMPYPHSAFLGGATLGLREGLTYAKIPFGEGEKLISNVFQASGTSHVLAVSGLHVGVIAGAMLALFGGLRIPQKIYAPMILVALLVFTIITGARPATIRASIMTGLIVIGMAYLEQGLKDSVLFGLSLAALFILLYNPKLIYEASFTLSFSAVLCLALLTGPVEEILEQLRDLSFVMFWVCLFVTVGIWFQAWNLFFEWYVYLPYTLVWSGIFYLCYQYDRDHNLLWGFGFHRIPTAITGFIAAQFAIQLGMMWPLSSFYFQRFALSGAFANLIAIPLVGVVVPLGLLVGLIGLIPGVGPWIALLLNAGNYLAVTAFLWITYIFAELFPFPFVRKMTLFHVFTLYAGLILFAFWKPLLRKFKRVVYWFTDNVFHRLVVRPRPLFLSVVGIGSLALFGASFQYEPSLNSLKVTVLNVGYGSSIAVETPDENRYLLNGGPRIWDWHNEKNLPERRDQGKWVVAPYFLNKRVKSLNAVVAQAPEPQYIGGLPLIMRHFSVNRAIGSLPEQLLEPFNKKNYLMALDNSYYKGRADASWFKNDYFKNWKRLWTTIKDRGIPYSSPRRGTTLYKGQFPSAPDRGISLEVLHPPERTNYQSYTSSNRSIVLSLRIDDGPSFLFPGDIRGEAQEGMVQSLSPRALNHDVMMVPSNGMQNSSVNQEFVEAVDPKYMVFSTGKPEIKGPLADKLEKRLKANYQKAQVFVSKKNIFRTDRDHAVTFETKGEKLSVRTVAEQN